MSTLHQLSIPAGGLPPDTTVALHCSASSGRQWAAYAGLLPGGMHLIRPDLMGYAGDPDWPRDRPVSLDEEAGRLVPVLAAARGGVHLLGHSYGGAVALQMALLWPQRVLTLTLYEPVRFALLLADPAQEPIGKSILHTGRRIRALARSGCLREAAAVFVDYWSGDGSWNMLPPQRQQAISARMQKVGAEFEALFADAVPARAYAGLTMPIRLIAGGRSPLPAQKVVDLIARQCVQAEVVRMPELGHMGPISHPHLMVQHLAFQPAQPRLAAAA